MIIYSHVFTQEQSTNIRTWSRSTYCPKRCVWLILPWNIFLSVLEVTGWHYNLQRIYLHLWTSQSWMPLCVQLETHWNSPNEFAIQKSGYPASSSGEHKPVLSTCPFHLFSPTIFPACGSIAHSQRHIVSRSALHTQHTANTALTLSTRGLVGQDVWTQQHSPSMVLGYQAMSDAQRHYLCSNLLPEALQCDIMLEYILLMPIAYYTFLKYLYLHVLQLCHCA